MWPQIIFLGFFGVCYGTAPSLQVARNYNHTGRPSFSSMPKTIKEAPLFGFNPIGKDCAGNPKFNGIPYKGLGAFAPIVLFDVKGDLAGFQIEIRKTWLMSCETLRKPFVLDGDRYVLTVYFMDPALVCSAGANKSESGSYRVFLQLGDSPSNYTEIPMDVTSLDLDKWKDGDCVKRIGKHVWLNTDDVRSSCEVDAPFFIAYDAGGKLLSFGHAVLYNQQFLTSSVNDILSKMFLRAAAPCLKTPFLNDMVYIFLSKTWVPGRCVR